MKIGKKILGFGRKAEITDGKAADAGTNKITVAAEQIYKFFADNGFTVMEYNATIGMVGQRVMNTSKIGGK